MTAYPFRVKTIIALLTAMVALSAASASAQPATDASATSDTPTTSTTIAFPPAGEARVIDEAHLDQLLKHHGKALLVVNFWATWCAPCVAEIPHFVEIAGQYKSKDVLFVGLSADFIDEWETKVPTFLKQKKVAYPNFVLDVDPNAFIPKFSNEWSGSLPATFYYDSHGKQLGARLQAISKEELTADIEKNLAK